MVKLDWIPNGLGEIIEVYGDCHDPDFVRHHIVWQRAPFLLRLAWQPEIRVAGFMAHRLVGPAMADALAEMMVSFGLENLRDNDLDLYGGVFNPRGKRGGAGTSTHAWGIAIDWCPALGPMGQEPNMPAFIVDAFESRGFIWGGRWSRPDGMHFQAAREY